MRLTRRGCAAWRSTRQANKGEMTKLQQRAQRRAREVHEAAAKAATAEVADKVYILFFLRFGFMCALN